MNFHSRKQPSTRRHIPVKLLVLTLSFLLSLQGLTFLLPEKADSSLVYAGTEASEPFMENLLFLGDSMIYNPEDIRKTFSKHGHQVFAAMGATLPQFSGVTRKDVTIGMSGHYVKGNIAGKKYNGIVILMGANDLANHNETIVFGQYKQLLQELQSVSTVPVYVLQIFPVNEKYSAHYGNYQEKNRRAVALNEMLWQYCESTDGLYFVDATNGFLGHDGQLLHDYGDGLHMDPEYYGMFYEDIMTAMATLKDQVECSFYNPEHPLDRYWLCRILRDELMNPGVCHPA